IYYAGDWTHDFGDGKGEIPGAYGKWFISLNTGWDGIGIHGTHDPASVGTNASEGCIRLRNHDLEELKEFISAKNDGVGVNVIILEN
ncbi:MAG: L,D-transpeptidase, partial [Anaerovibrio sp.]|uniref:L,D-transpeptidase n=1 Tax=Anaerovibrio sp. TaxID=1872532 RepID=UPI0025E069A9